MSKLRLVKIAEPSSPASNKIEVYMDTVDNKLKSKDYNGIVHRVSNEKDNNILDNGGFMIQQKIAVASTAIAGISTTTRAGVVADRWAVTTSVASNLNWQQVDTQAVSEFSTGLFTRYYGSIISATAGKKVMISQFIINREMAHLRGKKVRLSVKTKQKVGTVGQTYKLGLLQLGVAGTVDVCPTFLTGAWSASTGVDPVFGANLLPLTPQSTGALGGSISGNYLNIITTAIWQKSSVVFTIPEDAKNIIVVLFADATGGTTDNFSIGEFFLSLGEDDADYNEESFIKQLLKCQQYFCKTFAYGTVPVQNAGINTGEAKGIAGKAGAVANAGFIFWRFPVKMWKTPVTVTLFGPGAASAQIRDITGAVEFTGSTAIAQLDESVRVNGTGNAATAVGNELGLHFSVSSETVN